MSFQGYLNTIKEKTGKGPDDFRQLAAEKGITQNGEIATGVKAGDIVKWLKDDFDLGHGHAMAIYALLKGMKNEDTLFIRRPVGNCGAAHLSSSTLPGSSIKPFTALSASFSAASAVLVVFFGALTIG